MKKLLIISLLFLISCKDYHHKVKITYTNGEVEYSYYSSIHDNSRLLLLTVDSDGCFYTIYGRRCGVRKVEISN